MTIQFLNGFTCCTRRPLRWDCGTLELLIETDQGPVLVDTGLGREDYTVGSGILRLFRLLFRLRDDPQEAVFHQLARLGVQPEQVRNIVLTHMHFDHCGGLPDFPWARVHVYGPELRAFLGPRTKLDQLAYVRRHAAHGPRWVVYERNGGKWFDFDAIRLPFTPEMWLLPLPGHSRGTCGLAVRKQDGWLFQTSDAAALFNDQAPDWLIRLALGPHHKRIRSFAALHPEIQCVAGHMWLEGFVPGKQA